jgi:hypothetical protein
VLVGCLSYAVYVQDLSNDLLLLCIITNKQIVCFITVYNKKNMEIKGCLSYVVLLIYGFTLRGYQLGHKCRTVS